MADSNACQNYKHYYQQKPLCTCWDLLVLLSICSISGFVVSATYRTWKTSPACLGLLGWLCRGDVHCFLLVAGGYYINWPMSNVPNCDHSGMLFTALIKLANSIESSFLWIHNFTLNRGLQWKVSMKKPSQDVYLVLLDSSSVAHFDLWRTTPVCVGLHQVLRLLALPSSRYQLPTPLDGLPLSFATFRGDLQIIPCLTQSQQWSLCLQLCH